MARFSIENFGCRATEADVAALRASLHAEGLALERDHRQADVVVLNTCTVTAAADAQAREAVRKIHRANPRAQIVVTGCYAQRAPEELAPLDGVSCVVGNSHQAEIPRSVAQMLAGPGASARTNTARDFVPVARLDAEIPSLAYAPAKILTGDIFAVGALQAAPAAALHDRTRPILKIQDGCNNRCGYCVIPFVRGRSRSLMPDVVVEQVQREVAFGAKELVLSGINLGSYGRDLSPRTGLGTLARRILDETELDRLRFSSIEPQDVTEDFVALMASSPRIAPHFHMPLQSGSDGVLRTMHRRYRAAHYAERIKLIGRQLPDAAIGADVIAGFPGETEEDFQQTMALIERLPFAYLHVFSFSARPGTEGEKLTSTVPPQTIRERARMLRALGQSKAAEFRLAQAGRAARALTLARQGDGWTEALTGNYLKVRIRGAHAANEWHDVQIPAELQGIAHDACCTPHTETTAMAASR